MIHSFTFNEVLAILRGAQATMLLSLIAFIGGGVGGIVVALARSASTQWVRLTAAGYIDLFQGTPLLMQLFLVFYGLPVLGVSVNVWVAAAIGLTFHASAFLGEIWRGGIQAVPKGQSEASAVLGLGHFSRLWDIVLPQAFRLSLAPTIGFLVQLIKGTSLAAIIGFVELSRAAQLVSSTTYKPLLAYGLAGTCYFVICFPLTRLGFLLERRLASS